MSDRPTPGDLHGTARDVMLRYQRRKLQELVVQHELELQELRRRQAGQLDRLQEALEEQALHLEAALTPATETLTYGALVQEAAAELRDRAPAQPSDRHGVAALNTYLRTHPHGAASVLSRLPYWDSPDVRERLAKAMK